MDFPENFGVYTSIDGKFCLDSKNTKFAEPLFISSVVIENKIYFIPYQSNCIVTLDVIDDTINVLFIPNEEEDTLSWERNMRHKYLLEYVKDEKYLWLYSFKQKCILEVDLKTEQVKCLEFKYDKQSIKRIQQLLSSRGETARYENEYFPLGYLMENDFICEQNT